MSSQSASPMLLPTFTGLSDFLPRHFRQAPTPHFLRLSCAWCARSSRAATDFCNRHSTSTLNGDRVSCATCILWPATFLGTFTVVRDPPRTQEEDVAAPAIRQRNGFTAPSRTAMDSTRHGGRLEPAFRLLFRPLQTTVTLYFACRKALAWPSGHACADGATMRHTD
jgi:hypothetical protein